MLAINKLSRAHILVIGKVQGVCFRVNTKEKAQDLDLEGWVKNVGDDKVEIVAEGPKQQIETLIKWAKHGSELANVNKVKTEREKYKGEFNNFKIL